MEINFNNIDCIEFMTMAYEFDKLPKKERKLMKKQAETMAKYLYIFSKRIDIIKE